MGKKWTFFSNNFDTSSEKSNPDLMTHYYSNTYEDVKIAIKKLAELNKMVVSSIDDQYQEMLIVSPKTDYIITIHSVSRYENGVDITVTSRFVIPANRPSKLALEFFDALNHRLYLKRKGASVDE